VVDATPPPSPPPLLSDRNVEEETRGTRECEEETDAGGPESEGRERCLQYGCGGHSDERPYEHTGALKQCLCIVNYSKNTHGRKLEERLFYPSTTLEHRLKFSCITFEHHICDCPTSAKKKTTRYNDKSGPDGSDPLASKERSRRENHKRYP